MNQETLNQIHQNADTQLSFDDFKKSLGIAAQKYSNEEIEQIRLIFDQIADVVFDHWLYNKKAHNIAREEKVNV